MASLRSISKRDDWAKMQKEVDALIKRLRQKPEKPGYQISPEGILNAYREGDITFNKAVKMLELWKDRKVYDIIEAKEEPLVHLESQRDMRIKRGF